MYVNWSYTPRQTKSLKRDFSDCPDMQPLEIDYKGIKFDSDFKQILICLSVELNTKSVV